MSIQLPRWASVVLVLLVTSACSAKEPAKAGQTIAKAIDTQVAADTQTTKAPSRITSKVDVAPVNELTDDEAREVSFAAGRVLKHVAQAREAIRDKRKDDATRHVNQGLTLIDIIDAVLPHYKVQTDIQSGDQAYHDEEDLTQRYVVLFDELARVDLVTPIAQAKKEADATTPDPLAGNQSDKSKPVSAKEKAQPALPIISHADLEYSTLRLDFRLAQRMLKQAQNSLAGDNLDAANGDLLTIQAAGVIFEFEEIDLPLEQAADNLKLAELEMKEGRHEAAKAALHAAADELKQYEEQAGENRAKEVKTLHEQIGKLTAELEKGKPTDEAAEKHTATISELWHKVTKWFKNQ